MDKIWSSCLIIWSTNIQKHSGKTSVNINNCLSLSCIRNCKIWGVAKICGPISPCVQKRAWSYLVVGQGFTWLNRHIGSFYQFQWHCCACGEATVNSFVVLTKLEFLPVILINIWVGFSSGRSSVFGIIDYWRCKQLFLHWRFKVWIQD